MGIFGYKVGNHFSQFRSKTVCHFLAFEMLDYKVHFDVQVHLPNSSSILEFARQVIGSMSKPVARTADPQIVPEILERSMDQRFAPAGALQVSWIGLNRCYLCW